MYIYVKYVHNYINLCYIRNIHVLLMAIEKYTDNSQNTFRDINEN